MDRGRRPQASSRSPRRARPAAPTGLPRAPAPAPATGDDDLFSPHPDQTIDVLYVMGRAGELVIDRFWHVVAVTVGSALLSGGLLYGLVQLGALHNALWSAVGIDSYSHPGGLLVMMVLSWAAALLMQTPLVGSAIETHADRRGLFAVFLNRGLGSLPQIIGAALALVLISVGVVTIALVLVLGVVALGNAIPVAFIGFMVKAIGTTVVLYTALRVIIALSLVAPVLVVEQVGVVLALRRSWTLGWPNAHAVFWAILVPMLVFQAVVFLASFMPWFVSLFVALAGGAVLSLYNAAVVPVAYVAIREFVDGLHPVRLIGRTRR